MINRNILYESLQHDFFEDVLTNQFANMMQDNFFTVMGRQPAPAEYNSWIATGDKIKNLLELANLNDIYISFEYLVPYTQKRIDCLLFGKNEDGVGVIVHIELKQWQKVEALDIEGNFVETYVGGGSRKVSHPSQQVEGYQDYLMGFVEAFEDDDLDLIGCSYCPNYRKNIGEGLFNKKYKKILEEFPVYTSDDVKDLANKLKSLLAKGDGFTIFNKLMSSPIHPSKKLLESISNVVEDVSEFSLIGEQIYAKNIILDKIRKSNKQKSVILIKGGPGTGKTVIALNILAELAASKKKQYNIGFASKSKPLIEAIKYQVGKNARLLFTSLNSFVPSRKGENELDVLIVDEAHRIGNKSNNQFTKVEDRTDMPQVEQLVRCAKTSIFFIDDKQNIRSLDVGSSDLIKDAAEKYNCDIREVELNSQFRCNGSDNYLDWLETVLGYSNQNDILKEEDRFDFQIFSSPGKLYKQLIKKNKDAKSTARLVAGFCWPWSKTLDENGELVKDVKIGNFAMPWETHGNVRTPNGYVRWYEWAYKSDGIKQVGCIYTAQGFEFDYIGVIIGPDIKYDKDTDSLVGNIDGTKDPMLRRGKDKFDRHVKNIYRVLMSRGMKGCYIYCVDKEVGEYFRKRVEYLK